MNKRKEKAFIKSIFQKSKVLSELSIEYQNELIENCYSFMCKYEYDINERTIQLYTVGVLDGMIIQLRKLTKDALE